MLADRWRRQLPVVTRITIGTVAAGVRGAMGLSSIDQAALSARVGGAGADVLLTDSGTSALVLALRATTRATRVVAMPAYACVDLVAAAQLAGVRFVCYDIDPLT
ncbi:MAG: hypothetical protein M3081_12400, partial [Gemmatimonadota bacterium]|nr:hypothetical protein [Gemmatimonadota bacterium]